MPIYTLRYRVPRNREQALPCCPALRRALRADIELKRASFAHDKHAHQVERPGSLEGLSRIPMIFSRSVYGQYILRS